jgi:broad specificity phosphatase PhoE
VNKLILIKHAQPEIEPEVDARYWHLSLAGRASCDLLAQRLAAYAPALIVSSDEWKAIETAQLVGQRLALPTEEAAGLHEHDRRGEGYLSGAEFQKKIALLFAAQDARVYGNESGAQARERFSKAVRRVVAAHRNASIAIVAHGTVISLFVAQATNMDGYTLWRRLGLPSFVALSLPHYKLLEVGEKIEGYNDA